MQIAFRVDASSTIGTGHVMRCLTLADTLGQRGADCTFISRQLPGFLKELILSNGHKCQQIGDQIQPCPCDDLAHAHFLGTSQAQDAKQTQHCLETLNPDWLIIDHYGIDRRWESALRPFVNNILVIDDLADRDHDCELLVDQNLYEDMSTRYAQRIPDTARQLLGLKYAILRSEFAEARKSAHIRTGDVRRIFVFFGGMDSANYTLPVLQSLCDMSLPDTTVDVVIGAEHVAKDDIQKLCQQQSFNCIVQTKEMASLLLHADIAIGAGGSTSWERCCLGLPSLAFVVAPNQEALTLYADRNGLVRVATSNIHDAEALRGEIESFIHAKSERERMSTTCFNSIDARGAHRIAEQMGVSRIQLRKASAEDAKQLFEWRNHPDIRSVSTKQEPILWETHLRWFNKVINDSERPIYIGQENGEDVGVIRFDVANKEAEVSLYMAPDQIGKGLGAELLLKGEQQIQQSHPRLHIIKATVVESNEASHNLFKRCGYEWADYIYTKEIKI